MELASVSALGGARTDTCDLAHGHEIPASGRSRAWRLLPVFAKNRGAVVGLVVMIAIVLVAVFADLIAPYDPYALTPQDRLQPPSWSHWMGTDLMGRDILTRVMFGARPSLLIGLVSVCFGATVGTVAGVMAGFYGRGLDAVIMRIADAMLALPGILLALTVIAALGTSLRNVMLAVGIATIPQYARLSRGSVLSVREEIYIEAARVIGASDFRIMARHILPNVTAPIIVLSTLQFGIAILVAAGLSYLGLGAQPPTPEWGLMVSMGRDYLRNAWWMATFPGLTITVSVIAINLIGDGLRETLDPRLRMR
jgi:peptide/nickel transport system permease protein